MSAKLRWQEAAKKRKGKFNDFQMKGVLFFSFLSFIF